MCEERSDELKRRVYWILTYIPDTSKCNVAATKFFAISNDTDAASIATRFARRRSITFLKLGGENKKKVRTDREFILMRTQESVPENWEVVVESFRKRHRSEHSKGIMESIFGRNEEERTSRTDDLDILGMTEEEVRILTYFLCIHKF